jgi:hypothetical protein
MEDKKIRLEKIREILKKAASEVDTTGLVFFAAVSPDDSSPDDIDTPAFYLASGEQGQLAGLIGSTLGDMMLKVEQAANSGPDQHYRVILLEALVMSVQRTLGGDGYPGAGTEKKVEDDDIYEDNVAKIAGVQYIKKGGNS